MMTDQLADISRKIEATEAKLEKAKESEEIQFLRSLLIKQQETLNILLRAAAPSAGKKGLAEKVELYLLDVRLHVAGHIADAVGWAPNAHYQSTLPTAGAAGAVSAGSSAQPMGAEGADLPERIVANELLRHRVPPVTAFTEVLQLPLPFKIPIRNHAIVRKWPDFFELGNAEYFFAVDHWLTANRSSVSSEMVVVAMDFLWQSVMELICDLTVCMNETDPSSQVRLRPDFTGLYRNMLVIKCEAKSEASDIPVAISELISKFHESAHVMFPAHSPIVPGIATSRQTISLHRMFYNSHEKQFREEFVKSYRVWDERGRVQYIVDVFKICRWIASQTAPIQHFHLVPDVRVKTRNNHHVTLLKEGILKEFYHKSDREVPIDIIRQIYKARLPNVEQGHTNDKSITITTVGRRLSFAIRQLNLDKNEVWRQVELAVQQLHSFGFAHCDICVDNVFVNLVNDVVFLGDLEYCQMKDESAPKTLRRSDSRARTGEELDFIQLDMFRDELARL